MFFKTAIAVIIYLSVLSFGNSLAGEAVVLSLDDAVSIALRENRDILLNQEKLSQAMLMIGEAKALFLPEVNFTGGGAISRGLYSKEPTNYSTQAGIKQYLYRSGKAVSTLRQSQYKKEVEAALLDKTTGEVILKVKKAFYALLLTKEFIQLNKEILENNQRYLDLANSRYQKGEASQSEVLKAEFNLSGAGALYKESVNQLANAVRLLKNILYIEDKSDIDIKGELDYAPREIAIDQAMLEALIKRPEIRQYAAQVGVDKASIEITKSASRPSVYASWDYYSRSTASASSIKGWQDYNVIGLTFTWPVFDGWATKYKVEQALSDLRQDQLRQDRLKSDITRQVEEAYLDLKTAIAKLIPKKKSIEVYQDNLRVVGSKYKDGILSELDLNDAELALSVSRFNQGQATYDCLVAKAKLDNAMGAR